MKKTLLLVAGVALTIPALFMIGSAFLYVLLGRDLLAGDGGGRWVVGMMLSIFCGVVALFCLTEGDSDE